MPLSQILFPSIETSQYKIMILYYTSIYHILVCLVGIYQETIECAMVWCGVGKRGMVIMVSSVAYSSNSSRMWVFKLSLALPCLASLASVAGDAHYIGASLCNHPQHPHTHNKENPHGDRPPNLKTHYYDPLKAADV